MPLYDGDVEQERGIPENGKKLMDLMISHHGFLIASPEYNSSVHKIHRGKVLKTFKGLYAPINVKNF